MKNMNTLFFFIGLSIIFVSHYFLPPTGAKQNRHNYSEKFTIVSPNPFSKGREETCKNKCKKKTWKGEVTKIRLKRREKYDTYLTHSADGHGV